MKKSNKRILLTGDDGYQSAGTRILINVLRQEFDLTVVGTKVQQSAVGGKLSLSTGFSWGKDKLDGVPAFWVSGSPADAMEFAAVYFDTPFDLIISGMNWGLNVGPAVFSSGTVNAALRGLGAQVSIKAIAISWDIPFSDYLVEHAHDHDLSPYFPYPGNTVALVLHKSLDENLWGTNFININLPKQQSDKIRFTKFVSDNRAIFTYSKEAIQGDQFSYAHDKRVVGTKLDKDNDIQAVNDGFISISPAVTSMTDQDTFTRWNNTDAPM